jgi:hypothetical protein
MQKSKNEKNHGLIRVSSSPIINIGQSPPGLISAISLLAKICLDEVNKAFSLKAFP